MRMQSTRNRNEASCGTKGFPKSTDKHPMGKWKAALLLFGLFPALSANAFSESPQASRQTAQLLNPRVEILAESVWVTVKNRQVITKLFLVFRNPVDSTLATGFSFPLTEKDTLVDFGTTRLSAPAGSIQADSSPHLASLNDYASNPDSASADSQPAGFRLAAGDTVSLLLVYQTAPGSEENRFRYVFPLKESFRTSSAIRSFAFFADIDEKAQIMEVRTENYPIVVRGNGPKRHIYFWQNNLYPKADLGFSYRAAPKKPEAGP